MYEMLLWLWMGRVNQQGILLSCCNVIPRISLTEVNNFNSNVGHLKSHNNLDLENHVNAPTQIDLNCVCYVPTSYGTRWVKSYKRGTCKAQTENLFIISKIGVCTDVHTFILSMAILSFFLTKLNKRIWWLTWMTISPPSFNKARGY